MEHSIEKTVRGHEPVALALVRTIPGVGNILALVRRYASEEIARFPRAQTFVSHSRLVKRAKEATGKRDGTRGKQIGHTPLQWTYPEAAVLLLKSNEPAQQYLAMRANRHSKGKARASRPHTGTGRLLQAYAANRIRPGDASGHRG